MKKKFACMTLMAVLCFVISNRIIAQGEKTNQESPEEVIESTSQPSKTMSAGENEVPNKVPVHTLVKAKFIEGGAGFMGTILICLIFGLAFAIERIIYLHLASVDTKKLLGNIENALDKGGIDSAMDICRDTRGPVASIFYQGLKRSDEGLDMVEKSIISYGSVQMGLLEKNLSWIALFIAIAPMLGFLGTVYGMVLAFDAIRQAGNVSPQIVAQGIGVALLTTLFGLIVAILLQIFYNYILAKIDGIVNKMEDASISMMDILIRFNIKNR